MCFVSNVFPETMETQVVRVLLDRTLQFQSIPPLLPAYNKYMGGIYRRESDQWSLKVRVIPEMVFQVVVPSVELVKLAYREESVATAWM